MENNSILKTWFFGQTFFSFMENVEAKPFQITFCIIKFFLILEIRPMALHYNIQVIQHCGTMIIFYHCYKEIKHELSINDKVQNSFIKWISICISNVSEFPNFVNKNLFPVIFLLKLLSSQHLMINSIQFRY